jgi:hypothetical protein
MNGAVFVAVKKEPGAVLLENLRHAAKLPEAKRKGDLFCRTTNLCNWHLGYSKLEHAGNVMANKAVDGSHDPAIWGDI